MPYDTYNEKIREMLSGSNVQTPGDYSSVEQMKPQWEQLASMLNSLVLVFDVHRNTFLYVSDDYLKPFGINPADLLANGHTPVLEIMHPEDIKYGFFMRRKLYSILTSLPVDEVKNYKATHEFRVKNLRGEWIRAIEHEQVICTDENDNLWLMLSIVDTDASSNTYTARSHLYNHVTGRKTDFDLSDILEEPLTDREWEVLRLMHEGALSKEIAARLHVSINTINTHRQNILRKLGANNTVEALNYAKRLGVKMDAEELNND